MVVTTRRNLRSRSGASSPAPVPAKTPKKTPARRKKAETPAPAAEPREDLSKLTRDKLRARLKKHGLPIGKVKQEMIDTLTAYYDSLEDAPPGATEATTEVTETEDKEGEASIVGRRIAKVFDGETYLGTVDRFVKKHRVWKIKYDDGDVEEMEEAELLEALELFHGSAGQGAEGDDEAEPSEIKKILSYLVPFVLMMLALVVWVSRDVLFDCGAAREYAAEGGYEEAPVHHSGGLDGRAHEDL